MNSSIEAPILQIPQTYMQCIIYILYILNINTEYMVMRERHKQA